MKFTLLTSAYYYEAAEAGKLQQLGFTFRELLPSTQLQLAPFTHAIEKDCTPEVEISTLEELIAFEQVWGSLIIEGATIELYNCRRED